MSRASSRKDRAYKSILILGISLVTVQVLIASSRGVNLMQFGNIANSTRTILHSVYVFPNLTNNFSAVSLPTSAKSLPAAPLQGRHEGHAGFELAASVREACKSIKERSSGKFYKIIGSVQKRLLYCPMEKIGTTFWRRVMYVLTAKNPSGFKTPYDVPITTALKNDRQYYVPIQHAASALVKSSSFSFLFVRNPYSRLLSAFVDKLVPPNPHYWKAFGTKAITAYRGGASTRSKLYGHDVTFPEFVKHVTHGERTSLNVDPHYISTFSSCRPCATTYNYIGKMENFKDDALFILSKAGMNSSVKAFSQSTTFVDLTIQDAINDSIHSPFSWKNEVIKIISWDKALRRVWLKLQMRGIISVTETFDSHVSPSDITNLTANQFISIASKAHRTSKYEDLRKQKTEAMKEAFSMLHMDELKAFRNAFKNDFLLFGYDDSPGLLYNRTNEPQVPTKYFNYAQLN